jgi:response regulator RpfG family c-di-GMP phosphodiesterase
MSKPRVLCVDDEPNILEAMRRTLSQHWEIVTARGGEEALELLHKQASFAVIVSDLRMPTVDGVSLLHSASERCPETVRILLTGHADTHSAISAVNDGRIFRFLTKPCQGSVLRTAIAAGVEQHRLITAERVLLDQTLRGSIRALVELLSLVHPLAGAQTSRIRRLVNAMADLVGAEDRWSIEVSAMLAHLGYATLPIATVLKVHEGTPLLSDEQRMVDQMPGIAARLVASLPRMEGVQAILVHQNLPFEGEGAPGARPRGQDIPLGARLLKLARDYDALEVRGISQDQVLDELAARRGQYDPELIAALRLYFKTLAPSQLTRVLRMRDLQVGMVLAEDLRDADDTLLLARGMEVTQHAIERALEHSDQATHGRLIRVMDPHAETQDRRAA